MGHSALHCAPPRAGPHAWRRATARGRELGAPGSAVWPGGRDRHPVTELCCCPEASWPRWSSQLQAGVCWPAGGRGPHQEESSSSSCWASSIQTLATANGSVLWLATMGWLKMGGRARQGAQETSWWPLLSYCRQDMSREHVLALAGNSYSQSLFLPGVCPPHGGSPPPAIASFRQKL